MLLRPLANQDEDRLPYLRQSAPGINETYAAFSVREIQDIFYLQGKRFNSESLPFVAYIDLGRR